MGLKMDLRTAFFQGFCNTGLCQSLIKVEQSYCSVICLCLCMVSYLFSDGVPYLVLSKIEGENIYILLGVLAKKVSQYS